MVSHLRVTIVVSYYKSRISERVEVVSHVTRAISCISTCSNFDAMSSLNFDLR